MNDILSVVMPAFNAQDYAEEAIKSVLLQTVKNWELIIVEKFLKNMKKLTVESK